MCLEDINWGWSNCWKRQQLNKQTEMEISIKLSWLNLTNYTAIQGQTEVENRDLEMKKTQAMEFSVSFQQQQCLFKNQYSNEDFWISVRTWNCNNNVLLRLKFPVHICIIWRSIIILRHYYYNHISSNLNDPLLCISH